MLKPVEQIRSFIAIELPEPVKQALRELETVLKEHDPSGAKWVDPENIHLTLKFLGNVEARDLESIRKVMTEVPTAGLFQLNIQGLGAFPNLRKPQVIWVGIRGELEKLMLLQKELETGLAQIGFPPENRAFTPHLTLARIRENSSPAHQLALGEFISSLKGGVDCPFQVASISLMRSRLSKNGAIYTRLASVAV